MGNQGMMTCPAYSFLISNEAGDQSVLFDLGVPKDFENLCAPGKQITYYTYMICFTCTTNNR